MVDSSSCGREGGREGDLFLGRRRDRGGDGKGRKEERKKGGFSFALDFIIEVTYNDGKWIEDKKEDKRIEGAGERTKKVAAMAAVRHANIICT